MDIKDFKNMLVEKIKLFTNRLGKKKAETMQMGEQHEQHNEGEAVQSSISTTPTGEGKPKKPKGLIFAVLVVVFFVMGGVLAYNLYFFYDNKDTQQLQLTLSKPYYQKTPNIPITDTDNNPAATSNNQIQKNKQVQGEPNDVVPQQDIKQVQGEPIPTNQSSPAKKAVSVRVSEYDPFKSEFEKKYQVALKKEKGGNLSLTELEGAIKESKMAMPALPPPPPPPPPAKQLKLAVYGTVVSTKDTYAITDAGIIRVGNIVEYFIVEEINNDVVTLRQTDNKNEIRNIFVKARGRQSDSGVGAVPAPVHAGGQQWPSSH